MIHGAHGEHGFFLTTEDTDFLVATLEILEEIFNKEWPGPEMLWIHGAHGSSEFKRMLYGIIFLGCFARCFGVAKTYDF